MQSRSTLFPLLLSVLATTACNEVPEVTTTASVVGEMTVHFVNAGSENVIERAMAKDMNARNFGFMGPEDFHYSVEMEGYPFTLFTTRGEANVPQPGSRLYEHEFIHMAAAANVMKRYDLPLARLMRPGGCEFTSFARFHEVCADFTRDTAPVYGAATKMPQLLSVVRPIAPSYQRTDDFVGQIDVTDIELVNAACLWDLEAMSQVRQLYDGAQGEGTFDALFPPHDNKGSCVEEQMELATSELATTSEVCVEVIVSSASIRPQPGTLRPRLGFARLGDRLQRTGEEALAGGFRWLAVTGDGLDCTTDGANACWVASHLVQSCD